MAIHRHTHYDNISYRDAFRFWIRVQVQSHYNYKLGVLKHALSGIIVPWNSSIEQLQQATPSRWAVYEFIFGFDSLVGADEAMVKIVCKMNEMEERYAEMQSQHEPEEWFVPIMECSTDH